MQDLLDARKHFNLYYIFEQDKNANSMSLQKKNEIFEKIFKIYKTKSSLESP